MNILDELLHTEIKYLASLHTLQNLHAFLKNHEQPRFRNTVHILVKVLSHIKLLVRFHEKFLDRLKDVYANLATLNRGGDADASEGQIGCERRRKTTIGSLFFPFAENEEAGRAYKIYIDLAWWRIEEVVKEFKWIKRISDIEGLDDEVKALVAGDSRVFHGWFQRPFSRLAKYEGLLKVSLRSSSAVFCLLFQLFDHSLQTVAFPQSNTISHRNFTTDCIYLKATGLTLKLLCNISSSCSPLSMNPCGKWRSKRH